jgi:hypothetical protein
VIFVTHGHEVREVPVATGTQGTEEYRFHMVAIHKL